jgi:biopolymer transport protein ExbD
VAGPVQDDDDILSAINITPFVDVVLVVLIIFLVTATYIITRSIPMDLPKASTGEQVATTLAISLDAAGRLYLNGRPTTEDELVRQLQAEKRKEQQRRAAGDKEEIRAVIAADGGIEYRRVMHLMDLCRRVGISRLAFNIKSEDVPAALSPGAGP